MNRRGLLYRIRESQKIGRYNSKRQTLQDQTSNHHLSRLISSDKIKFKTQPSLKAQDSERNFDANDIASGQNHEGNSRVISKLIYQHLNKKLNRDAFFDIKMSNRMVSNGLINIQEIEKIVQKQTLGCNSAKKQKPQNHFQKHRLTMQLKSRHKNQYRSKFTKNVIVDQEDCYKLKGQEVNKSGQAKNSNCIDAYFDLSCLK